MTHFAWQPDGGLEIGGHAYISSVDPIEGGLSVQASLVNADTAEAVQLTVRRHSDRSIDWESNDNWTSYAEAGFRTTIDPAVMLAANPATPPATGTFSYGERRRQDTVSPAASTRP